MKKSDSDKELDLPARLAAWKSRLPREELKESYSTSSGIEIQPLYLPPAGGAGEAAGKIGFPGMPPFTRGPYPSMYRGRLWTMRQYAGFGSAEETNRRFRYLLEQGQTGLSVAFDLPTQLGLDSNHPQALGEVGRVGVAIDTLEDMRRLFSEIPLASVSTSMTINATAPILLAMYVAVGKEQSVAPSALSGTVQNDILKEYVARGNFIYPAAPSLRLATDIFDFCSRLMPRFNPISISGYHIREAGATAVQELAFTFANAICYVEAACARGLKTADFAPRLSFFFNAHSSFFEEIAKFRAARRIWYRIMRERFHAEGDASCRLRFHTQTAGSTLTAQQPENNIARVAFQALSAVLGGTQSLHTNSFDEALSLPSRKAAAIALRTQQIIASESGAADTIDPLAGSYFLESLTDRIEQLVWEYLERIDSMGGAIEAIESGFIQREIHESAYAHQKRLESGSAVVVGLNKYVIEEDRPEPHFKVAETVEADQVKSLESVKSGRDPGKVSACLKRLEREAKGEENLIPAIIEAVEEYCTVGEISDTLAGVFGRYRERAEGWGLKT